MFALIKSNLDSRGRSLMAGQYHTISCDFAYPLAAFLESRQVIVRSAGDLLPVLQRLRDELHIRRIVRLSPEISALELPRSGRFRAWVRWHEISADGSQDRVSDVVYYCRTSGDQFRTEMMNYTRLSMPELRDTFARLTVNA